MFTVKQLATLTRVTTRTLHYYDEIGLLTPTSVGANGYRYYGEAALLRLQQILLYRELGVPLAAIRAIMGRADFDVLTALESHREGLQREAQRLQRLVETVDNTILHLKGTRIMHNDGLFAGLNKPEHQHYAAEAEARYGKHVVARSRQQWQGYAPARQQAVMDEGNAVYADLVAAMPLGAAAPAVQAIVQRWRDHLNHFWTPQLEHLAPLAATYRDDPRFRANFDKIDPALAEFMVAAVDCYVAATP